MSPQETKKIIDNLTSSPIPDRVLDNKPIENLHRKTFLQEGMKLLSEGKDPAEQKQLKKSLQLLFHNYITVSHDVRDTKDNIRITVCVVLAYWVVMFNKGIFSWWSILLLLGTILLRPIVNRTMFYFRIKPIRKRFLLQEERNRLDSILEQPSFSDPQEIRMLEAPPSQKGTRMKGKNRSGSVKGLVG